MATNAVSQDRKITFETPPISRITLGRSPFANRKLSFPASLHANLLGLKSDSNFLQVPGEYGKDVGLTKRRFSNVGDVVSRKLSTTIGWRTPSVPPQEVVSQGRVLCGQYIKHRLRRSGFFNKKLGTYVSFLVCNIDTTRPSI